MCRLMVTKGECHICNTKGKGLTEYHIVETPDENGNTPSVWLSKRSWVA